GLEEFGEGHGVELGEEASHGFIVGAFAFQEAVVSDVMAAESFVAEGGGLAKFAGGQEVGAEGDGHFCDSFGLVWEVCKPQVPFDQLRAGFRLRCASLRMTSLKFVVSHLLWGKRKRTAQGGPFGFFGSTSILSGWENSSAFWVILFCAWNDGVVLGLVTKELDRIISTRRLLGGSLDRKVKCC
ncbi:MAG: hypothetical protein WBP63_17870, partial [Silvibacterium sp.]